MYYRKVFERLSRIDELITKKGTGSPAVLAERVKISERTLFLYLNMMRDLGAPIKYDHYRETYYYEIPGGFAFTFTKT